MRMFARETNSSFTLCSRDPFFEVNNPKMEKNQL